MDAFQRSTLKWTRATFAILAVTGLFICLQWIAMRQTVNAMKSSGDVATNQLWQAIGNMNWMARTADGALQQAQHGNAVNERQSKAALDASTAASRNDQRAWLGLDTVTGRPELNATFTMTVKIRNTGRSPAKNVFVSNIYEVVKATDRINFGLERDPHSLGLVQPNATPGFIVDPSHGKLVDQRTLDVLNRDRVYLHGTITYIDVFGRHHWTTYCAYFVNNAPEWGNCEQHNNEGDGNPPSEKTN
jgi:hypothetical protein